MSDTFTVDRNSASEILGVSIRTLDRYIRQGRLRARKINGFVKLDESEIQAFQTGYTPNPAAKTVEELSQERIHQSLDEPVIDVHTEVSNILEEETITEQNSGGVYEILYKETKEELQEAQHRLEMANYRVGQLESQVQNSVPLLEHRAASLQSEQKVEKLKDIAKKYIREAKAIEKMLELEKTNAKVYAAILFVLLGLQPILWIWLQR